MPELDLTNAQAITVAGQDALEIRVADQVIWSKPVEPRQPSHFWSTFPDESHAISDNRDQGDGITLGTVLQAKVSGTVTHIRFPVPDQYIGTTAIAGLYTLEDRPGPETIESQTIEQVIPSQYRATVSLTSEDSTQWKYVELPSPRHISAGQYMLTAVKFIGEDVPMVYFYGTEMNYFGDPVTNADDTLFGPANGLVPPEQLDGNITNGRFSAPYGIGWPRSIYGARGYYIDVSFYPDEPN